MQRLNSNGLSNVTTLLEQSGVTSHDLELLTVEDLLGLGIARPDAERAVAVLRGAPEVNTADAPRHTEPTQGSDEISLYRDFDEAFGRLLTRDGAKSAVSSIEALRMPRTAAGFVELVRVVEARSSQGDNAVKSAFVALGDRAIAIATQEGWDPQVIARAKLAAETQRQRLDEEARAVRETQEARLAARKVRQARALKGMVGVIVIFAGGIGSKKIYHYVQRERVLDGPMRVALDRDSVLVTSLGEHPLPANATLFNGRGIRIDDEMPIKWTMKYATPSDACVVSGSTLNVLMQNPDLTRDTECTLTYRPASIAEFGFQSCTDTYHPCELADGIPGECVDNICQPPDFDGTVKVKVDLDSSRQSRAEAKAEDAKGACFLTTAACEFKGQSDDCHELTTLRWFRDHVMRARADWSSDVDDYYEVAPGIVDAVAGMPDAARIWSTTFDKHIVPAVECIERGAYDEAYVRYRRLVRRLQKLATRHVAGGQ